MQHEFVDLSGPALAKMKERGRHMVDAGVFILRDAIVESMEAAEPRTGHIYPIPGTSATYRASAPGEAPAVREGLYRDSWQPFPAKVIGDQVIGAVFSDRRVGPNGEYPLGIVLEEGASDLLNYKTRIEPRPHIGPAKQIAAERIKKELGVQ